MASLDSPQMKPHGHYDQEQKFDSLVSTGTDHIPTLTTGRTFSSSAKRSKIMEHNMCLLPQLPFTM
jgi:hypothetical protein